MAECHPVGFQWVMEAKRRGAKVIHVDPRFTRTSAVADVHVPIRAGSDIVFLGAIVNHILENGREFREYVSAYTNAATIVSEDFRDTEDLDGLFSGWDPQTATYDPASWGYKNMEPEAAAGDREQTAGPSEEKDDDAQDDSGDSSSEATGEQSHGAHGSVGGSGSPDSTGEQSHGAHGGGLQQGEPPEFDPTLEHPRCVFQILKRHFSRYTPEMVERVCGVSREQFLEVAEALCENSGRERTSAFCYAVGWTQHTVGVQYIRTASIIQLLLGNIGRPGGGIMALRGHASIQGSTDIPTLYNILPGYLPMPKAAKDTSLEKYLESNTPPAGFWGHTREYMVSLLKAWWGDAATAENDYCYDHLPRLTGDHSIYPTVMNMRDGKVKGFFVMGENPAVGSGNAQAPPHGHGQPRLAGRARPADDRDGHLLEGRPRGPDRRAPTRGHPHRGVLPARRRAHREGRLVHQHPAPAAVAPQGDRAAGRLPLGAVVHVPPRAPRAREAGRLRRSPRPGRSSTSPGTTRPRAATTTRPPRPCCARSPAWTPMANRCRATRR